MENCRKCIRCVGGYCRTKKVYTCTAVKVCEEYQERKEAPEPGQCKDCSFFIHDTRECTKYHMYTETGKTCKSFTDGDR